MNKEKKRGFTLLEIVICMAVLAMASLGIGWQMRKMIGTYRFQKSVEALITNLRKAQLVALSDRVDIDFRIVKEKKGYRYQVYLDDPIPFFISKSTYLSGIKTIMKDKKHLDAYNLRIYASGRVEPEKNLALFPSKGTGVELDLTQPLRIGLKKEIEHENHKSQI